MATFDEIIKYRNTHNKFAAFLGIVTTEISFGAAKGEMEVREEFVNPIHSVHGGCLFSLADTIGGAAAASHGMRMTTASGDFHYLSPAMGTKMLYAAAKVIKDGKKICVCDVEISDDSGKLVAKGVFSYFNLGVSLIEE